MKIEFKIKWLFNTGYPHECSDKYGIRYFNERYISQHTHTHTQCDVVFIFSFFNYQLFFFSMRIKAIIISAALCVAYTIELTKVQKEEMCYYPFIRLKIPIYAHNSFYLFSSSISISRKNVKIL